MGEVIAAAALSAAVSAAQPIVRKALERATKNLTDAGEKKLKGAFDVLATTLRVGFEDYMAVSYNQCRYFKSIINPNQPQDVTEKYVNVDLSINRNEKRVSDVDFVKDLRTKKSVVVSGLAGSGKSMLLRYITVSAINEADGPAPLFVELRQLNGLTNRDLLSYIRTSCARPGEDISEERFRLALHHNVFFLILDGFDEVNFDVRDEIQQQIFDVRRKFPDLTIVVSSRPDQRFGAWSEFYVYAVCDLSKEQTVKLISGLDYDKGVKQRFLKVAVEQKYDSHRGFLSSPLLATIMLLTYEEFAEIPSKMHAFYGQAFDTLIQKHDAQKRQFKRKLRTGLARDEFKSCFAAFCAFSYATETFSFSSEKVLETAQAAIGYMQTVSKASFKSVSPEDLVADLREAVCMLQQDGLFLSFVHRSFQEYFTALFVIQLTPNKIKGALDQFVVRFTDTVVPMSFDMARDLVECEWIRPNLLEISDALRKTANQAAPVTSKIKYLFGAMHLGRFENHSENLLTPVVADKMAQIRFISSLQQLYPDRFGNTFDIFNKIKLDDLHRVLVSQKDKQAFRRKYLEDWLKRMRKSQDPGRDGQLLNPETEDEWWISGIGFDEFFTNLLDRMESLQSDIARRAEEKQAIIQLFLR